MDPISQAAIGAVAAQSIISTRQSWVQAAVIGALAGMAPDLDVLIKSSADPLLALEYHRQFTHSLFFIPIGAALFAILFYFLFNRRWQLPFRAIYLWSFLGYASHGLLDGCTSYGTQLLWPLSDKRVAWNLISVVDPLFTLPLVTTAILAILKQSKLYWLAGVGYCSLYLLAGFIQNERAEKIANQLVEQRGHKPIALQVKPSFANIAVWKTVYEYDGYFYVDAVRPGIRAEKIWLGDRIQKLDVKRDLPWLNPDSQQAKDIQRFIHFSSGYVGKRIIYPSQEALRATPSKESIIIDIRYSLLLNEIDGLWGITLDEDKTASEHVEYIARRGDTGSASKKLLEMIVY